MKHATEATLKRLATLLGQVRRVERVVERKPGVFYLGGSAFVHFHESPGTVCGDIKVGSDWERLPVDTALQQRAFAARVRAVAGGRSGKEFRRHKLP